MSGTARREDPGRGRPPSAAADEPASHAAGDHARGAARDPAAPLTLGTAGHIDHGKTALVAALTGVDTDRLPQERARGISIELGYAPLALPSGRRLSIVDVPGHERFVRTMVAGATGIDLFLMAVAADDGVMPQTREHATVLAGLDVGVGVVAVTKADLADPELALADVAELLPGVEAIAVSARTGAGIEELRAALDRAAASLPGRGGAGGEPRLHVDRAFTIRGAGTVVTGTLWSGAVARGDELMLLPAGRRVRVRGVQVHDAQVERAVAGQRVALNLVGVEVRGVERGVPFRVHQEHGVPGRAQDRFGTGRDRRDERVGDVADHVANGQRRTPAEALGQEVRLVLELLDGGEDARPHLGADVGVLRKDPRHRRDRDVGQFRDLAHAGSLAPNVAAPALAHGHPPCTTVTTRPPGPPARIKGWPDVPVTVSATVAHLAPRTWQGSEEAVRIRPSG